MPSSYLIPIAASHLDRTLALAPSRAVLGPLKAAIRGRGAERCSRFLSFWFS